MVGGADETKKSEKSLINQVSEYFSVRLTNLQTRFLLSTFQHFFVNKRDKINNRLHVNQ